MQKKRKSDMAVHVDAALKMRIVDRGHTLGEQLIPKWCKFGRRKGERRKTRAPIMISPPEWVGKIRSFN